MDSFLPKQDEDLQSRHRRLALERLLAKASVAEQDSNGNQLFRHLIADLESLIALDDSALTTALNSDATLNLDVATMSIMHEASVIDLEVLLRHRTAVDVQRTREATDKFLRLFLKVLDAILQQDNGVTEEDVMKTKLFTQIVLNSTTPDVAEKFWRDDAAFSRPFCTFLSRCFTQRAMLPYLSSVILINPRLYRRCVGLKSQTQHIDKIITMAETYVHIPKLYLWAAYDRVLESSNLSEEEIFERCKDEICSILGVNKTLIEKDFNEGNTTAVLKWGKHIYQLCAKDKGRAIMHKLEKHVKDEKTQLAILWKEAQPVVALFPNTDKDGIRSMLQNKGPELMSQIVNHIMSTMQCDEATQAFVRNKMGNLATLLPQLQQQQQQQA